MTIKTNTPQQVQLLYPIEHNGKKYETLTLRRSKVRDRLAITKLNLSDEEKEIRLLANLADITPDVIEDLDERDYQELQKVYLSFFK